MITQRDRMVVLRNAVDIQAEVFTQRKILREEGKETTLNVLIAKTDLFEAQLELILADFDFRGAVFRLGKAVGVLNAATLQLNTP
jgi:outer membrane protein TolC